jgi:hypothetical protein
MKECAGGVNIFSDHGIGRVLVHNRTGCGFLCDYKTTLIGATLADERGGVVHDETIGVDNL